MRQYGTFRNVIGGCFECNGSDAIWTSANAQGVAARHHDATGHTTWVDITMSIRYGARSAGAAPPALALTEKSP